MSNGGHTGRSAAGWSSLVARRAHNPKVAGSNPAPATTKALVTALLRPGLRRSGTKLLTDLLTDDPAQGGIRGGDAVSASVCSTFWALSMSSLTCIVNRALGCGNGSNGERC